MKRIVALILCGVFVLFAACGKTEEPEKLGGVRTAAGDVYPEAVATIEGETVGFDEFRYYYMNYRDLHLSEDENAFEKEGAEEALKDEALDGILKNRGARLLAEERGISLSDGEKKEVEEAIKQDLSLFGEDDLIQSLHESYMSRQLYRESLSFQKLYQKLFDSYYGEGGTDVYDDEAFLRYYKTNYLAVQEIYLSYERGEKAGSCPQTRQSALAVVSRLETGEDFWKLVEEYGEDPGMELEPDGYYFTQGEAEEVLYQASLSLKENEVSEPIEAATGIYIIRRVPIRDEKALKRKTDVLNGYEDGAGVHHAGVYENLFLSLVEAKSQTLKVEKMPVWDEISTKSVY